MVLVTATVEHATVRDCARGRSVRAAGLKSGALTPFEEDGALDLEEQQRVAGEEGDDEHEKRDGKAEDY